ncbi:hypothetical protein [Ramlibacter sp. AN1133]|uniref:hypothetical protein n=1 Tax=Ramlibacter sp. AN1133 TaxID=3133429 RepID=UPI0030BD5428
MTCRAFAVLAVLACEAVAAPAPAPAPAFDVAYRAWDIVTELAREHRDANISGECGRTFRPFVIPGLRMQGRQDQDRAATACQEAARAACADARLRRSAEVTKKCEEFR